MDPVVQTWLGTKTSAHTRRAYAFEAESFLQFCGKPLRDLTLSDLQRWMEQERPANRLKAASRNRALTAVKSLLSFAHESGHLTANPGVAAKVQPDRDRLAERILSEEEVERILEALAGRPRDRLLLTLLYVSGIRVSELCGLRWRDLQIRSGGGGQITVFGKGGKTRAILLPPDLWQQLIDTGHGKPPDAPVFESRKRRGGPLDASQVRRIVYAAAKAAGLPEGVSPHWMRHAHASHALDHNAPIHLVQATLGHASVATTGRYLHARPTESSSLYLTATGSSKGT
jgi:site-specific recombinase XerD